MSGKACCTALQRVVPRLILITAYVFYLLFGGLIFSLIEGPRYKQLVAEEEYDVEIAHQVLVQFYGNSTVAAGLDSDDVLDKLKTLVYAAEHPDMLMSDSHNKTVVIGEEWTFGNAVLFCMTTTSTIGYGHLVPHTFIGGFLCIVYSSIGIPLTLLLIADLGRLAAISFMKTYRRFTRRFCSSGRKPEGSNNNPMEDPARAGGSGGIEPDGEAGEHDRDLDLNEITAAPVDGAMLGTANGDNQTSEPIVLDITHAQQEIDDDALLDDVPIFLPPIIFWSYIILSAPGFGMIEGWSFAESIYFLYVSVTTIGFGDLIPRSTLGLVFAWTGLIVTAMCVALSYRKIIKVATWVLHFLESLVSRERIRQRDARYSEITI